MRIRFSKTKTIIDVWPLKKGQKPLNWSGFVNNKSKKEIVKIIKLLFGSTKLHRIRVTRNPYRYLPGVIICT